MPAGRPSKKTKQTIEKLEYVLERDGTILQACNYAWIDPSSYYLWLKDDDEFSNKMAKAQDNTYIKALEGQYELIAQKDSKSINEFLKRRDKRYSDKQQVEHQGAIPVKWEEE